MHFCREVQFLEKLRHPKISQLVDHNTQEIETERELFLVANYIEGEDLDKFIQKRGTLSLEDSVKLILRILNTLQYCHNNGVVHRDIKPNNIRIAADEYPVLMDFGISFDLTDHESTMLTGSQQPLANDFLRLPELDVSDANPVDRRDQRSDICLVAGLLFYMLTLRQPRVLLDASGEKPHRRPDAVAALQQSVTDSARFQRLMGFLDKAFEYRPPDRFQNIEEFSAALFYVQQSSIPGLRYDAEIKRALRLSTGEPIEVSVKLLNAVRASKVYVFSAAVSLKNNELQPIQNYHAVVGVPKDIINGSPEGQMLGVGGDFLYLRRPVQGQPAVRIEPGHTQNIAQIQCKITIEHLDDQKNSKSRCFLVDVFRRGEKISSRSFEFSDLGFLDMVDLAN